MYEFCNEPGDNCRTLKLGRDYKLTYKNNVNPGTATITVTGIGHYKGSFSKTFKIVCPMSKVKIGAIKSKSYKGKPIEPKPTVTFKGKKLKLNTDYTLSYKNNNGGGVATVIIRGKGRYSGKVTKTFKIYSQMKYVKLYSSIPAQYLYSKAAKPNPDLKCGSNWLYKNKNYTLTYKNNTKGGTATIIVKGKGYYKGKKTIKFKIVPKGTGKTITKAEFNKIKVGMSYKQVKYLIGGAGSLTYQQSYKNYDGDGYAYNVDYSTREWKGNRYASGASISFENGSVVSKGQWGL